VVCFGYLIVKYDESSTENELIIKLGFNFFYNEYLDSEKLLLMNLPNDNSNGWTTRCSLLSYPRTC